MYTPPPSPLLPRLARRAALFLAFAAGPLFAQPAHHVTTGFTRLQTELGAGNLATGSGLTATQVEAPQTDGGTNFAPDAANAQFAGKSFTISPTQSTTSGHATGVGQLFYGLTSSTSPRTNNILVYNTGAWINSGGLNIANNRSLPISNNATAQNHSWIGAFDNASTAEDGYLRLDYLANNITPPLFVVAGMDNGSSTTLPQLMGQGYNLTTVGRSDGRHSAGFTTVAGSARIKPDIVAPAGTTSNATPMVGSAGLFLRSTAAADSSLNTATHPRVLKSLLLASASKYKFPEWAQTSVRPLDLRYGAGELNLYNAHRLLTSGRREPSSSLTHPARGWSSSTTGAANTTQNFFFEIPADNTTSRFATVLIWHRQITVSTSGNIFNRTYTFTPNLANLTLRLHSATNFTVGTQIAESASPVDNVEHLYLPNLAPGRYALVVQTNTASTPYSLAWFTAPTVALSTNASASVLRSDSTPLTFTFTRAGGDLSLPLTIPLNITGNAVSGIHYTPAIPASLTFAPNTTTAGFTITPVSAANPDAPSATLSINLASDFASAPDPSANTHSLAFHARPYSAWRSTRFTPAQLADPLVSGDTADPDADGLANLLEYAFGLEPLSADSPATASDRLPSNGLDAQNHLTLSYFHATDRPDLVFTAEYTTDLAASPWQSGPTLTEEVSREPLPGGERVTVRALAPSDPDSAPRHFLRLRVTRQ
jgi:hypothetical protein